MPNNAETTPSPRRSAVTPYIAVWAVLALGAVGYIGWIATHPELIAQARTGNSRASG